MIEYGAMTATALDGRLVRVTAPFTVPVETTTACESVWDALRSRPPRPPDAADGKDCGPGAHRSSMA